MLRMLVQIIAITIVIITFALAVLGQFFEVRDPNAPQPAGVMETSNAQAIVADAPRIEVQRTPGAVVCKFDPVTENPQQFAADYLFGELTRNGDVYTFSARVAVPSGGYTVTFGDMSLSGTQVVLEANLSRPQGMALEMIDTVGMRNLMRFPPQALTLRVVLNRNFAWGPNAIICSIMRPPGAAPVITPVPVAPVPAAP